MGVAALRESRAPWADARPSCSGSGWRPLPRCCTARAKMRLPARIVRRRVAPAQHGAHPRASPGLRLPASTPSACAPRPDSSSRHCCGLCFLVVDPHARSSAFRPPRPEALRRRKACPHDAARRSCVYRDRSAPAVRARWAPAAPVPRAVARQRSQLLSPIGSRCRAAGGFVQHSSTTCGSPVTGRAARPMRWILPAPQARAAYRRAACPRPSESFVATRLPPGPTNPSTRHTPRRSDASRGTAGRRCCAPRVSSILEQSRPAHEEADLLCATPWRRGCPDAVDAHAARVRGSSHQQEVHQPALGRRRLRGPTPATPHSPRRPPSRGSSGQGWLRAGIAIALRHRNFVSGARSVAPAARRAGVAPCGLDQPCSSVAAWSLAGAGEVQSAC
jgi:hypothetical protein